MGCGCKIGKVKRRKIKERKVNITAEDIIFGGLGVIASLAINPLANKALDGQNENVRNIVGTALPAVKLVGGGYLAMQDVDRRARWFGVGVGMEGAGELALRYIPENYVSINGVDGDIFSYLGATDEILEIPITPSAGGALPSGDLNAGFEQEGILGTSGLYEEVGQLQEML